MTRAARAAGVTGNQGTTDRQHFTVATVTPAGSNSQANSTVTTTTITFVATLSNITTRGVRLVDFPSPGLIQKIVSLSTTNMKVYPGTSAKLGTGATANANVSLAAKKSKTWMATTDRQWVLIDQLA